jgi:geranylgeranyl diphosphate synthase, type I
VGWLDEEDLRARVQKTLDAFLDAQEPTLSGVSDDLAPFTETLRSLLSGGKRLRPAFCYWGWRGAGADDCEGVVVAATSLELLQACALIHDDVMDDSDTRRGQPSVHHRFAAQHRTAQWRGDPEDFGYAAAILLGDLALSWSDQLLFESGLPADALRRGKPVLDIMRTELMAGQYLDLAEQARGGGSVSSALRVARFKSAKYTIERPLHLGAALAGAGEDLFTTYSAYGLPLGEAFQLRDDVLGVFGDPSETGKPAGDDLREGKRTALVAYALEHATPAQTDLVHRHLGDPHLGSDGVAALREVIVDTGALGWVETLIDERTEQALAAMAGVAEPARTVLGQLVVAATARHA